MTAADTPVHGVGVLRAVGGGVMAVGLAPILTS